MTHFKFLQLFYKKLLHFLQILNFAAHCIVVLDRGSRGWSNSAEINVKSPVLRWQLTQIFLGVDFPPRFQSIPPNWNWTLTSAFLTVECSLPNGKEEIEREELPSIKIIISIITFWLTLMCAAAWLLLLRMRWHGSTQCFVNILKGARY